MAVVVTILGYQCGNNIARTINDQLTILKETMKDTKKTKRSLTPVVETRAIEVIQRGPESNYERNNEACVTPRGRNRDRKSKHLVYFRVGYFTLDCSVLDGVELN